MKKRDHLIARGIITLKSGMRIGGSDDVLQIGGTDLTCIKDPVTGKPYIPGTSMKGKMRSELEKELGKITGMEPCGCASSTCPVCRVFGPHKKVRHELGPTRILVRDALLLEGGEFELKTESSIQRNVGAAMNPRTLERVVPGSKFRLEIGMQAFDRDDDFEYQDADGNRVRGAAAILEVVYHALDLVEQSGLGSGTSKGYGQVEIEVEEVFRPQRRRGAGRPRVIA